MNITITLTEVVDGISVESTPTSITVFDGVLSGGGGAVDSVNGQTGIVVLVASDVGAQPVDSDLTAIAALSTTTFGRALLALVDAPALRTAAGLGTAATQASTAFDAAGAASTAQTTAEAYTDTKVAAEVVRANAAYDAAGAAAIAQAASQPLDSDLTAIAALATTTFGRSLLTAADAAGARTLIGAGTSSFDGTYSSLTGKPTLGTAAAKDIPTSGNASATQVVYGSDTRLSDARTPTSHTHPESDVTGLTADLAAKLAAANNLSDVANAGTSRTNLGLGTSATKDVAASGNASSTQVVKGDDTRLSDSRTPAAHASTHAAAGSDPITISESQVTNLVTDLAGKAASSHTHAESDVTSLASDLAAKAPLASPTFTGTPAAPTATAGTNTTQVATTAFVTAAVAAGGGGGSTLDPFLLMGA